MANFLLLLHDDPSSFGDLSPDQIQEIIGEYTVWRQSLEERGRLVDGQKLKDEGGRSVTADRGVVRVVDGPYAEAKEVLGGYFMVEAGSYAEAVDLCRDSPHLTYGGRIEVREVDPIEVEA